MWFLRRIIYALSSYDWVLSIVVFILTIIGMAAIYSVDLSRGVELVYIPTQLIAFGIGVTLLFILGSLHRTVYEKSSVVIYVLAVILLVMVLLFGVTIRGTTGWFRFAGFSFQPAEFAKVALPLFLGFWILKHGRRFDKWQFVFTSGLAAFVCVFLILLQPDLGSAFVVGTVWFSLLLLTGTKKRYIAALLLSFVVLSVLSWFFVLKPYQKDRLTTFLDPNAEGVALTTGYNVNQSLIAVGSGGFFGRGLGFGSQSQLRFLPEAQTDFIFAVIAEELGFIGAAVVLFLYGVLLWRLIAISLQSTDDFTAYTTVGIAIVFFVQMVINVGATVNVLPVTGVTLPFVSYGGSSLIINYLLIGIVQSIVRSTRSLDSHITIE